MYTASDTWREPANPQTSRHGTLAFRHAVAGLQAGVVGVLAMFACLMIGSLWHGRSIWVVPNLLSTTFFGVDAYRNQMLTTSWSGIALTITVYGALGTLWGCIWKDRSVRWLVVYGAVTGVAVYFFFYDFVWRHLNPLITLYAPDHQLEFGHAVWGMVLACSPLYSRRISRNVAHEGANSDALRTPPALPEPQAFPLTQPPALPADAGSTPMLSHQTEVHEP